MAQGAPKGNEFWKLRSKHGRDRLFATPELMWEAACEYFQWCVDNPLMETVQSRAPMKPEKDEEGKITYPPELIEMPKMRAFTLQGLCLYLNCNTVYFHQFEYSLKEKEDQLSKDFSKIIHDVREVIWNQKFTGAASGFLNHNIIARDLGLAEKNEHTGKDGAPIPIAGNITHNINFKDCDGSGSND